MVSGGFVYVGSGNGRLIEPADEPAGAACSASASVTASRRGGALPPEAVLGRPGIDRDRLYFGCRDGWFYAAPRRRRGGLARNLGSPP
ncbi:MAG: hypothetical protein U0797_11360 [Gemmataceae bacterium]